MSKKNDEKLFVKFYLFSKTVTSKVLKGLKTLNLSIFSNKPIALFQQQNIIWIMLFVDLDCEGLSINWYKLPQKLKVPRYKKMVAMVVPDNFLNCTTMP